MLVSYKKKHRVFFVAEICPASYLNIYSMHSTDCQIRTVGYCHHFSTKICAGNFEEALVHYDKAIDLEPENAILYSNRSATYNELGKFWSSLEDARRTNRLSPKFVKGHLRRGAACANLGHFGEALEAFREALDIEPDNKQAQSGFEEASQKFFSDSDQIYRYAIRNPQIRDILCNSEIRTLVQEAVQNPKILLQMTNGQRTQVEKLIKIGILRFS